MTWIDIILIIVLGGLVVHGIVVGLIRSIFDILGIIVGYFLALTFNDLIPIPRFLSFLLIFIIVAIGVAILGRILSKLIHITPLGIIDRILGGVLGFLKGFIVCFVFLLILLLIQRSNQTLSDSELAPQILNIGLRISKILPTSWYKRIKDIVVHKEVVENHLFDDYLDRMGDNATR